MFGVYDAVLVFLSLLIGALFLTAVFVLLQDVILKALFFISNLVLVVALPVLFFMGYDYLQTERAMFDAGDLVAQQTYDVLSGFLVAAFVGVVVIAVVASRRGKRAG